MSFVFIDDKQRIAKAKTKVRVGAAYHRLERLQKMMSRVVSLDLLNGITRFKKKISAEAIAEAWKTGSYGHIMASIPWDKFPEELVDYDKSMRKTWKDSTDFTIEALPAPFRRDLRFDINNPRIRNYINQKTGNLIVGIHSDAQRVVQRAVQRSFTHALTPRKVAEQLKTTIGLDPRREQALYNYRDALEEGGKHSPEVIDKLSDSYADRLLDSRTMTIGRQETRFATNQGQLSVWRSGADQGLLDKKTTKKVWIVDGNPCEICEPMDGVKVGLDEMWTLNTGDMVDIPTDSHVGCLCGMELDFESGDEDEN